MTDATNTPDGGREFCHLCRKVGACGWPSDCKATVPTQPVSEGEGVWRLSESGMLEIWFGGEWPDCTCGAWPHAIGCAVSVHLMALEWGEGEAVAHTQPVSEGVLLEEAVRLLGELSMIVRWDYTEGATECPWYAEPVDPKEQAAELLAQTRAFLARYETEARS